MAAVEIEELSKSFADGTRALSRVSLALADGELLVLVGPSGCGKSTLLRLVAGLDEPSSGTIRIGAEVVNHRPPQQRNVAMVFQDYALYPHMPVRHNLEFPLRMRRMARAERERRVARIADQLALGALLARRPRQLSGGERQRVAMGRALVRDPAVSLLDEPLSNLDAKLRVQVRAELAELQRRTRTTMIYVTHDQVEAMTLGQRVAVLDRGVLRQVGAPHELYERPANTFVAGFVGTPPMNLFPATLVAGGGPPALRVGGESVPIAAELLPRRLASRGEATALTAGVRPEDVQAAAGIGNPGLAATVEHVEYLGHETLLHARLTAAADVRLTARLDGTPSFAIGDRLRLRLDPERIHLFDERGEAEGAPPTSRPQPFTPPPKMPAM